MRHFLTRPAAELASGLLAEPELVGAGEALTGDGPLAPPERIGPYRILREVGRGGMATVSWPSETIRSFASASRSR